MFFRCWSLDKIQATDPVLGDPSHASTRGQSRTADMQEERGGKFPGSCTQTSSAQLPRNSTGSALINLRRDRFLCKSTRPAIRSRRNVWRFVQTPVRWFSTLSGGSVLDVTKSLAPNGRVITDLGRTVADYYPRAALHTIVGRQVL